MDFGGFYRVLVGFGGFYWVLLGFGGFDGVLVGFTGFYRDLLGFTGFFTTGHGWSNGALTLSETRFKKSERNSCGARWRAAGGWPKNRREPQNKQTTRHFVTVFRFSFFFYFSCVFVCFLFCFHFSRLVYQHFSFSPIKKIDLYLARVGETRNVISFQKNIK